MNEATDNLKTETPKSSGGYQVGQSTTDKVGFYGVTPVVQPSGAAQAQVVDESGGSADVSTGIVTLTGSYNSTIIADAIATLAAQGNAIQAALEAVGIIKGEA